MSSPTEVGQTACNIVLHVFAFRQTTINGVIVQDVDAFSGALTSGCTNLRKLAKYPKPPHVVGETLGPLC